MSAGKILAIAGGGGAVVVLGFVIAWALFRKPHASYQIDTTPTTPRASAAVKVPAPVATITPERAASFLNKPVVLEMSVQSVGKASTAERYFLNSTSNRSSPDNFTVTFTRGVLNQLGAQGLDELRAKFQNKKVRVTAMITKYDDKPQIEVISAEQIQIVNP